MAALPIPWLSDDTPLPPTFQALGRDSEAPGLLAAGGRLNPQRLAEAYARGIFPWYSPGQPVLWWAPDPRMVLPVAEFRLSHSLRKTLRRVARGSALQVRIDDAFDRVLAACASTAREGQAGTWIDADISNAYRAWHRQGYVHSIETWVDGELAGGLYGVNLGRMFYGESMFAWRSDASKIALAALVAFCRVQGITLIDCQQRTGHLASLGAREISRRDFEHHLDEVLQQPAPRDWTYHPSMWAHLRLDQTST